MWKEETTQMRTNRGCLFRVCYIARQSAPITGTWQRVKGSKEWESYFAVKERGGFRYDWRSLAGGIWRRANWKREMFDWFESIFSFL